MIIPIFTLASDGTRNGTEADVFATEAELNAHLKGLIEESLARSEDDPEEKDAVDSIRQLLAEGDIGSAYDEWAERFRPVTDTHTWEEQRLDISVHIHSLLEAVADIAHHAGLKKYYGGDSRQDIQDFIAWAKEFEAAHPNETWEEKDYIDTIDKFTAEKLKGGRREPHH